MPGIAAPGTVHIPGPTYNEHARAFAAQGWTLTGTAQTRVIVHPNNPDGRLWAPSAFAPVTIIDESFCDVTPDATLIGHATRPNTIILKSFGKFWGLAGLRLGFAIGDPALIAKLAQGIGPWAVSGPALAIGARALNDPEWARATRARLTQDAARLDAIMDLPVVGGTDLFRLYDAGDAAALQSHLARAHLWTRVFPYSTRWLRLGLPGTPDQWARLQTAMAAR
jgi:cobalamin biosynthetic protein CobC